MSIIMLDYGSFFTPTDLKRFADCGCEAILNFDCWADNSIAEGRVNFEKVIEYAQSAKTAGIKVLFQTPQGSPLWFPDDWFLKNESGECSNFLNINLYGLERLIALCESVHSYWCVEAENYCKEYISEIRKVVEPLGAECICNIGVSGEYFFPSASWYPFLGVTGSAWRHDNYVKKVFADSGISSFDEFCRQELIRVTVERLSLYQNPWLQYVPYFENINLGAENAAELAGPDLKRVLFTVFAPDYLNVARKQSTRWPTWGGAEGPKNVVAHSIIAKEMGLAGLVCGIYSYPKIPIEPWMFDEISKATRIWAEG